MNCIDSDKGLANRSSLIGPESMAPPDEKAYRGENPVESISVSSKKTIGRVRAILMLMLLLPIVCISSNLNAGSISGRLVDDSVPAVGMQNVYVNIYGIDGSSTTYYAFSGPDGSFIITDMTAGDYKVKFDTYLNPQYITEWYYEAQDLDSAAIVTVNETGDTALTESILSIGGTIEGVVRSSYPPMPLLEGVSVSAYVVGGESLGNGTTDSDGLYSIQGLPAGDYQLYFNGSSVGHDTLWYDGTLFANEAVPVPLGDGEILSGIDGIDMVLNPIASLTGTVVDQATRLGIWGATVTAIKSDDNSSYGGSASTDSTGSFTLQAQYGSYKLQIRGNSIGYDSEWYDDASNFDDAEVIDLTTDSTLSTEIDLIEIPGAISGRVTDEFGDPIQYSRVWAKAPADFNQSFGAGFTDSNGEYSIRGLPPGDYKILYDGRSWTHLREFYNDKDMTEFDIADIVTVGVLEVPSIDAVLDLSIGDLNFDEIIDTTDLIIGLQILAGLNPEDLSDFASLGVDGTVGFDEILTIMRKISE